MPPELPITLPAPSNLAICPASEPTAPAAPVTNTTSPARTSANRVNAP